MLIMGKGNNGRCFHAIPQFECPITTTSRDEHNRRVKLKRTNFRFVRGLMKEKKENSKIQRQLSQEVSKTYLDSGV